MSRFVGQSQDLLADGARLRVVISPVPEDLGPRPGVPPRQVPLLALVDTGSGRSLIHPSVAKELSLRPVGRVEIDTTSSTDVAVREFDVRFGLDERTWVPLRVLEAPLPVPGIRAVIGRDLLAFGTFFYDGRSGHYAFELSEAGGR